MADDDVDESVNVTVETPENSGANDSVNNRDIEVAERLTRVETALASVVDSIADLAVRVDVAQASADQAEQTAEHVASVAEDAHEDAATAVDVATEPEITDVETVEDTDDEIIPEREHLLFRWPGRE